MTRSDRRAPSLAHSRRLALGAALACAGIFGGAAQAADIGHSRLVSAPGAPLQVLVPVRGMSADEAASLKAAIAPLSAWSEVNLAPPVALKGLRVLVEPGRKPDERQLRIVGAAAPAGQVVDLLLDVSTASGQRRVQVSLLVPSGATPAVSPAVVAPQSAAPAPAAAGPLAGAAATREIQRGDTLFAIARANPVEGAGVLQVLVALWQANPDAFIGNNMNLLRTGASLTLPDAAAVRAVDPREASRIYQQQVEAFNRGRGAGRAGQGGDAGSGKVGSADATVSVQPAPGQDRVRLSAADAAADESASSGKAIDEAGGRVDTLQRNVDQLKQALGENGAAAGAQAGPDGEQARNGGASGSGDAANASSASGSGESAAQAGTAETNGAGAATAGGNGASAAAPGAAESGQAASPAQGGGAPDANAGSGTAAPGGTAGAGATPPATSGGNGAAAGNGAAGGASSNGAPSGSANGLSSPSLPAPGAGSTSGAAPVTPATPDAAQTAPRGNWWSENLLAIVTGVLALIAFIIAWAMRRAGARQDDDGFDNEDDEAYDPDRHGVAQAAFQDKLQRIDLELDDRRSPPDERR